MGNNYAEHTPVYCTVCDNSLGSSLYCFVINNLNTRYAMFAVAGLDWGKTLHY